MTAAVGEDPKLPRLDRPAALFLLACAALLALSRLPALQEPLEPDLVTYATIGHEMVQGGRLYTDVWDLKPPALYATYAAAELVAGYGVYEIYLMNVLACLATLLGVYAAGAAFGRKAGMWAAALWVASSTTLGMQANQPNAEVFINACCAIAFALLVNAGTQRRLRPVLAAGALFALASMYKQLAVFPAVMLVAAHIAAPPAGISRSRAVLEGAALGAVGLAAWLAVFAYGFASGQSAIYWATIVGASSGYAGSFLFNIYRYVRELHVWPRTMLFLLPLLATIAVAAWFGLPGATRRRWLLLGAWIAGINCMIAMPGGAFHPHAYQYWLPALAVGGGWAFVALAQRWGAGAAANGRRALLVGGLNLALILAHELPERWLSPKDSVVEKYGPQVAGTIIADRAFALALAPVLHAGERVFLYGDGAAIYFYGLSRPPTLTLWATHLLPITPLAQQLSSRTLAQLRERPPALFAVQLGLLQQQAENKTKADGLVSRLLGGNRTAPVIAPREHPIYRWAMANYHTLPAQPLVHPPAHLTLYVHAGSDLERRLQMLAHR